MPLQDFMRLIKPYQGKLYAMAQRHDPQAAQELTLAIITAAYRKVPGYPPGISFPVWLSTVARDYLYKN